MAQPVALLLVLSMQASALASMPDTCDADNPSSCEQAETSDVTGFIQSRTTALLETERDLEQEQQNPTGPDSDRDCKDFKTKAHCQISGCSWSQNKCGEDLDSLLQEAEDPPELEDDGADGSGSLLQGPNDPPDTKRECADFKTEHHCEASGCEWGGDTCEEEENPTDTNRECASFKTQAHCQASGCTWGADVCKEEEASSALVQDEDEDEDPVHRAEDSGDVTENEDEDEDEAKVTENFHALMQNSDDGTDNAENEDEDEGEDKSSYCRRRRAHRRRWGGCRRRRQWSCRRRRAAVIKKAPKDGLHQECWTAGGCKDDGKTICGWCGQQKDQLMYCCKNQEYAKGHACHQSKFSSTVTGHQCVVPSEASQASQVYKWLDVSKAKTKQSTSAHGGVASRAIDGSAATSWSQGSCTHTNAEKNPWWEVDLGSTQKIKAIAITGRGDCCEGRLSGFTVSVDGTECATKVSIGKGETKLVTCNAVGKTLRVGKSNAKADAFTICEVKVAAEALTATAKVGKSKAAQAPTTAPAPIPPPATTPPAATTSKVWFCVAKLSKKSVTGPFSDVAGASAELNKNSGSSTNRQMICEMSAKGATRLVAQDGGSKAGFNKWWGGWGDINDMNKMCSDNKACKDAFAATSAPTQAPTQAPTAATSAPTAVPTPAPRPAPGAGVTNIFDRTDSDNSKGIDRSELKKALDAGTVVEKTAATKPTPETPPTSPTKTPASSQSLSRSQMDAIVKKHNDLRAAMGASDMMEMTWDDTLAAAAQKWVSGLSLAEVPGSQGGSKCPDGHSQNRNNAGENMAWKWSSSVTSISPSTDYTPSVQDWYDEVKDAGPYKAGGTFSGFDQCTGVCGHYTQVVWAAADKIGCAAEYCPHSTGMGGYELVCQYGSSVPGAHGGNMRSSTLFTTGAACSKCPSGFNRCSNKLCSPGV